MRTCRIGVGFAGLMLILAQGAAQAEWVAIDARYQSHPLYTAYFDPNTVHREGRVVALSALIDWKAMQGGRSPTRFYSTKLSKQIDCVEKRVRTLASTDFYGHMGTGEVIGGGGLASEDLWVSIEPGTIDQGLWEAACGKG